MHRYSPVGEQFRVDLAYQENVKCARRNGMLKEEMMEIDERAMEMFGTLDVSEKTIAIPRRYPQEIDGGHRRRNRKGTR